MNIEEKAVLELNTKTKDELIEEILLLKKINENNIIINKDNSELDSELSRTIIENSHEGILIINEENKIEYANDLYLEFTGKTKDEIIGKDFLEILNDEISSQEVINRYKARMRGEFFNSPFEISIVSNRGERKIFEIRSTLFQDSLEKLKILLQFKDITQRKIAEEAIRQSEEKFRSIVENSHLGILIIDMNYCFEYVNA